MQVSSTQMGIVKTQGCEILKVLVRVTVRKFFLARLTDTLDRDIEMEHLPGKRMIAVNRDLIIRDLFHGDHLRLSTRPLRLELHARLDFRHAIPGAGAVEESLSPDHARPCPPANQAKLSKVMSSKRMDASVVHANGDCQNTGV